MSHHQCDVHRFELHSNFGDRHSSRDDWQCIQDQLKGGVLADVCIVPLGFL